MNARSLVYNSVTISLPKNIIQFIFGILVYWLTFGFFDWFTALTALSGYLLAYSSVYFFNDIIDADEDRKHKEKITWKIVANGTMSKKSASVTAAVFAFTGLALSAVTGTWFLALMAVLLFLNFLHSWPGIRLKKRLKPTALNMSAIEFIKFSCGWFALTSDFQSFPFWIILTFSVTYSAVYLMYKFNFKGDIIRSNKPLLISMGIVVIFSYLASIFSYNFTLPLLIVMVSCVVFGTISTGRKVKLMSWMWLQLSIFLILVISFSVLSLPAVSEANSVLISMMQAAGLHA